VVASSRRGGDPSGGATAGQLTGARRFTGKRERGGRRVAAARKERGEGARVWEGQKRD
jgi:hypothetical protein